MFVLDTIFHTNMDCNLKLSGFGGFESEFIPQAFKSPSEYGLINDQCEYNETGYNIFICLIFCKNIDAVT